MTASECYSEQGGAATEATQVPETEQARKSAPRLPGVALASAIAAIALACLFYFLHTMTYQEFLDFPKHWIDAFLVKVTLLAATAAGLLGVMSCFAARGSQGRLRGMWLGIAAIVTCLGVWIGTVAFLLTELAACPV